jgi:uncharacterized coiled-coil DUF342 family protein
MSTIELSQMAQQIIELRKHVDFLKETNELYTDMILLLIKSHKSVNRELEDLEKKLTQYETGEK